MADEPKDSLSLTDDEEENGDEETVTGLPEKHGTLSKWTNYIHGWQDRYIALKDSTLSYYKSEQETTFGCRGAISLAAAHIQRHEFDECRFDVGVNDSVWYLRARNEQERLQWIDSIELHRQQAESGYGSENSLRRHGSIHSLASAASISTASASSFKRGRGLREKLAEMETFKEILCRQVDTLQSYFDACTSAFAHYQKNSHDPDDPDDLEDDLIDLENNGTKPHQQLFNMSDGEGAGKYQDIVNIIQQHGAHAVDFKGEAFTFKATTAGILATLSHCLELMNQREDSWRRRLEREMERRKRYEEAYRGLLLQEKPKLVVPGPDYEEGPHCAIHDDEFFDAVDSALDKIDRDTDKQVAAKQGPHGVHAAVQRHPSTDEELLHPIYSEIVRIVDDHISHADMSAADVASSWELIASEGDLKVYKMEKMENGLVVDPVKAVHTIKGVTGHELCHYFWDPSVRLEWEGSTLDSSTVIEWVSSRTNITHQVMKRFWPATQRESLFWSTIRHFPSPDDEGPDYWAVVNYSTDHPSQPPNPKMVRLHFNVAMICQTMVQPPTTTGGGGAPGQLTRDQLVCKIQYSANVNPGGWAPPSVVRMISKREVPKFLKMFSQYVTDKTLNLPILF